PDRSPGVSMPPPGPQAGVPQQPYYPPGQHHYPPSDPSRGYEPQRMPQQGHPDERQRGLFPLRGWLLSRPRDEDRPPSQQRDPRYNPYNEGSSGHSGEERGIFGNRWRPFRNL